MEVESSWKLTVAVMINYIRRALWPYCLSRKRVCWTELAFWDLPLMTVFLDSEQSAQLFDYYSNLCLLYILRPERPLFQGEVEFHFGRGRWVGWLKEKNHVKPRTIMRVTSRTLMRVASRTLMRVTSRTLMRVASRTLMRIASRTLMRVAWTTSNGTESRIPHFGRFQNCRKIEYIYKLRLRDMIENQHF